MIPITHPKVRSLRPDWSPFSGVTLLLERCGTTPVTDRRDGRRLNRALARAFEGLAPKRWQSLGFCPLPAESLHVTFADLLHQGNVRHLSNSVQSALVDQSEKLLPERAARTVLPFIRESGVLDDKLPSPLFRLSGIEVRNHRVIVAALERIEDDDRTSLLMKAREELLCILHEQFGLPREPYAPHVTLGYLANRDLAREAQPFADDIAELLDSDVRACVFDYGSPSLFTFSDMAHFIPWRGA